MNNWDSLVFIFVGFALSVAATLLGAYIYARIVDFRKKRPMRQILNFGNDSLLCVFPHREEVAEAILPRTSTEDFLAINNIISALLQVGWKKKLGVRDSRRVSSDDRKRNLVVICSPKSNSLTSEVQEEMEERYRQFFYFQDDGSRCLVTDGSGEWKSHSIQQREDFLNAGGDPHSIPEHAFDDVAIINKITNPWNDKTKVLVVAGIRGIGTWAAGECIKKQWEQIYDSLPEDGKDRDFSALILASYHNCDITRIEVERVIPLVRRR